MMPVRFDLPGAPGAYLRSLRRNARRKVSMFGRISIGAALCAVAIVAPLAANAQAYYTPPKLVKRGTSTTAPAGAGKVVVQVMVHKDGTFQVSRVITSTNHGNDAAALQIAKSSTYAAATRGATKLDAFYDFTLNFTANGRASSGESGSESGTAAASGGGPQQYEAMIRAGNYSSAQSGLKSYVAAHPGDTKAQADLGVASTFLNDYEGATAAFDKAGTIPSNYKSVAAKAYAEYTTVAIKNKENDRAVAAAKRAVELTPNFSTYNALGVAEQASGQNDAAVTDLEKARSLGTSAKPAERAAVDVNLVAAYLAAGKLDMAKQVAAEAKQLDPSNASASNVIANYYVQQAATATQAGKAGDAAAAYDQAAAAVPSQAAQLYARAAVAYLSAKPPDNDKAKAEADKALGVDPQNAAANYAAGVALANQPGKSKDALVYLNKADDSAKKGNDPQLTSAIENVLKQLGANK